MRIACSATFHIHSHPSRVHLCNTQQASNDLCVTSTPFDLSRAGKYAWLLFQAALSEYFCSPHIHWQHWLGISKDLDSLDKLDCLWDLEDRDFQEPCTFSKWDQSVELDFAEAFGDRELVQVTARTGLLHWLFDHPKYASYLLALGLTADNAYGCLSNYLFQATPALQKQLPGNVLETLSINTVIGIQIRCVVFCHYNIEGHTFALALLLLYLADYCQFAGCDPTCPPLCCSLCSSAVKSLRCCQDSSLI